MRRPRNVHRGVHIIISMAHSAWGILSANILRTPDNAVIPQVRGMNAAAKNGVVIATHKML